MRSYMYHCSSSRNVGCYYIKITLFTVKSFLGEDYSYPEVCVLNIFLRLSVPIKRSCIISVYFEYDKLHPLELKRSPL